jgi:hypothetical protein
MAFSFQEPKTVSQWVDYLSDSGEKQGRFKIRGNTYPLFQVELGRLNSIYMDNQKYIEYNSVPLTHIQAIFLAVAKHLIEDWSEVYFKVDGEVLEVPFNTDFASKLFLWGDGLSGVIVAGWALEQSKTIQANANAFKAEVVGKSESSTDGQDLATKQAKKPKKTTTSTNG